MKTIKHITGDIQINVDEIPECVRDSLVAPLIPAVKKFFEQPGIEEKYQEWLKEYKKRPRVKKGAKRETRKIIPAGISF